MTGMLIRVWLAALVLISANSTVWARCTAGANHTVNGVVEFVFEVFRVTPADRARRGRAGTAAIVSADRAATSRDTVTLALLDLKDRGVA